ncbi:uncharacterized protein Z520_05169 [Fonsecaea multimorphosa CBS 102226]|uniref:Carboxylic ester hydrolase n=1 Tax=Fonsecaea multimorphosa CBS 102226 TaxID=1442371 RepID=A0A0D2KPP6_9EURO|nr:uncharacterized protein Z520_05169 [Fonsecaea multimorphosa CBS 102226]KIX98708.1 hypothetical protein Z520_05169 [Fonsecaea multimorphosa CBS 102226]OAL32951.1 hypothetical protein AYO22_00036 [Fonsecaea multimorphosa]
MLLYAVVLLLMALPGLSNLIALSSSPSMSQSSNCTLTYIASQPPQMGPTSTVYQAIMTTFLYAVDCNQCTVTNIPNVDVQGPFTTRSTSSMLTVTEIQCIPEGTASTRMHHAASPQTTSWKQMEDLKKAHLHRRSDQATEAAIADLASTFANALPPDVSLLSGGLQTEFTDIASAMFALNICDSGIDLNSACEQLNTDAVALQLYQSWYAPNNVKSIVCFCASYGYDFDTTRQQLYASLYAALIGILAAADISTDRGQICDNLSLFNRTGPSLGIDIQQYHDLVCSSIPSPTPTAPPYYGPTSIPPYVTNDVTTWGTPTSWAPNTTISGTGGPSWTGINNRTTWGPPVSYTGTIGSDWSITINTQTNWTETQPTGTGAASDTATAGTNDTLLAVRVPRGPNAVPFYPAVTTSTSHAGLFKRY